jgi:y4mF family transcriptional regulator
MLSSFLKDKSMQKIQTIPTLGAFIRARRKKQGLTQGQLAAACGVGIRFLRELEHGKETCHIGKALHIVQMLGADLYMVGRDEASL